MDHQVIVTISQRDSGGVCDCGDPEAWVQQFTCKHHKLSSFSDTPIPAELEHAILSTIEAAVDYVIDVLSTSDIPMQRFDKVEQILEQERISRLSESVYGVPDDATENKYVLTIWNDQRHSMDEVVGLITLHLRKEKRFGDMVTKIADAHGRAILLISDDIKDMLKAKHHMEKSGLIHTIRSTKDNFREEMCDTIIHWLADISKASINGNFLVLGELVCQALCKNWRVGNACILNENGSSDPDSNLIRKVNTSLIGATIPAAGTFPPQPFIVDQSTDPETNLALSQSVPQHWLQDGPNPPSYKENDISVRVQYLIFFDIRLWKSLRNTLRDLYISVLVSKPIYKSILGHCYAQLYPLIAEMYVLVDREPECSIVNSLSTQLFTTPSVATTICKFNYFSMYMAGLFNFFTKFRIGPVSCVETHATIPEYSNALKNRRFGQLFHDFEYILNRNTEKSLVTGNINRIKQVCDFLMLFQGVLPLVRQKDTHVEFESDLWIRYFNCMPSVLQLANTIAVGIHKCEKAESENAIRVISEAIYQWAYTNPPNNPLELGTERPVFKRITIPIGNVSEVVLNAISYKVEDGEVSLHHPLHAFLSWIIQYGHIETAEQLRSLMAPPEIYLARHDHDAREEILSLLFDYHVRVLVLLSQIKIGLWVRNGLSIRNQMNYYRDITLRDPAFSRDIFMVQTSLAVLDPNLVMFRLMDRWGLLDWQTNPTFDDHQRLYMVEDFIHYLIVFISERRQLMGLSVKDCKRKYIVKEIIQCLAFKAMSFSEICDVVPDLLTTDEMFEIVLSELTTFKPPVTIRDSGLYELKPEYMSQFDTCYLHFSSSKMGEAETVLKTFVHKKTGQPLDEVVMEPMLEPFTSGPFANIGAFTRTPSFTSFIYDLLAFIVKDTEKDREGDVILSLVLRLLHVAALDDLNVESPRDNTFVAVMCKDLHVEWAGLFGAIRDRSSRTKSSVVLLLYSISQDESFQTSKALITRIIEILHTKDSEMVSKHIRDRLGDIKLVQPQIPGTNKEEQKSNERKKFAKKKQKKILANLQKQQKMFAEKNKKGYQAEEEEADMDTDDLGEWSFPRSQCILCRMPCDSKSVFGVLGHIQKSNGHRTVPFHAPDWVYEAYGSTQNLDDLEPEEELVGGSDAWKAYKKEFRDNNKIGPGFPNSNVSMSTVIASCCHTMHHSCYTTYMNTIFNRGNQLTRNNPDDPNKYECLCPLCRSINNTFIPIPWKSNTRSIVTTLETSERYSEFLGIVLDDNRFNEAKDMPLFSVNLFKDAASLMDPHYASILDFDQNTFPSSVQEHAIFIQLDLSFTIVASNFCHQGVATAVRTNDFSLKALCDSVAATISDLETSIRGVGYPSTAGGINLDQIPTLSLTIARVLTEYTSTMIAYCYNNRFLHLGTGFPERLESLDNSPIIISPSPFSSLIKAAFFHSPGYGLDMNHFVRSYFIGEILNVLSSLVRQINSQVDWVSNPIFFELPVVSQMDETALRALSSIVGQIRAEFNIGEGAENVWAHPKLGPLLYTMLLKSVTPFLRKSAIFMFARCAKDYDPTEYTFYEEVPEADKLCDLLKIPHLGSMLVDMCGGIEVNSADDATSLVYRWLQQAKTWHITELDIEYPGVVKLLHLSRRLDEFFSLPILRSKDGEAVIAEPAICLFCGELAKVQQTGRSSSIGECNKHLLKCGQNIGIFLLPKRSSVLFLNDKKGSFMAAPYLDLHGESEDTMRCVFVLSTFRFY